MLSHLLISRIFPRKRIFQQSQFSLVIRGSHRWGRFLKSPKISWYWHYKWSILKYAIHTVFECSLRLLKTNERPWANCSSWTVDSTESRWVLSWTALSQDEWVLFWTALSQDECYPGYYWVKMSECYPGQRWVKMSAFLDSAESGCVLSWTALSQDECYPGQRVSVLTLGDT